jgi:hypothetical protein
MTIANDNIVTFDNRTQDVIANMDQVQKDMDMAIAVCRQNRAIMKALDNSMETLQFNLLKYKTGLSSLDNKVEYTNRLATSLNEILA